MSDTRALLDNPDITIERLASAASTADNIPTAFPLVVKPKASNSLAFLKRFLQVHSERVVQGIHEYGGVLFRGFEISNDSHFEDVMADVEHLHPMSDYFMREPGRVITRNTSSVFRTNTLIPTGGGLRFGGFHAENYYSIDVPSIVGFFCERQPRFGGDTSFINMADVYDALPASLRATLEKKAYICDVWKVSHIASRYGVSADEVDSFCAKFGISVTDYGGNRYVCLYKPSVFLHPVTNRCSLQINLSGELRIDGTLLQRFLHDDYADARWLVHRLLWKYKLTDLLRVFGVGINALLNPTEGVKLPFETLARRQAMNHIRQDKLGQAVTLEDTHALANRMYEHMFVFKWQSGDLLLFDNQQLAHAGMPGFGPRTLDAMIFNPIPLDYASTSGVAKYSGDFKDGKNSVEILTQGVGK